MDVIVSGHGTPSAAVGPAKAVDGRAVYWTTVPTRRTALQVDARDTKPSTLSPQTLLVV